MLAWSVTSPARRLIHLTRKCKTTGLESVTRRFQGKPENSVSRAALRFLNCGRFSHYTDDGEVRKRTGQKRITRRTWNEKYSALVTMRNNANDVRAGRENKKYRDFAKQKVGNVAERVANE